MFECADPGAQHLSARTAGSEFAACWAHRYDETCWPRVICGMRCTRVHDARCEPRGCPCMRIAMWCCACAAGSAPCIIHATRRIET
eukprot:5689885-Prymnesium_polylepis.1